jgi:hypothetical protein
MHTTINMVESGVKHHEITNNKNKMILLLDSRFYLDMSSVPNVHLLSV